MDETENGVDKELDNIVELEKVKSIADRIRDYAIEIEKQILIRIPHINPYSDHLRLPSMEYIML